MGLGPLSTFLFVSFFCLLFRPPEVQATLLLGQVITAGSGYNKAIQLRNTLEGVVNLTTYGLLSLPKGQSINTKGWSLLKAPVSEEPAFLGCGDSYVIAHPRADSWLVEMANALSENFLFDGSDVLALAVPAKNGTWVPIDIVGDPQQYNISGYSVAGIPGGTRNHTLYRKANITSPTTDWALSAGTTARNSQWLVLPSTQFIQGGLDGSGFTPPPLCSAATGAGGDRRSNKSQLRVATWTVDWLFDGQNDPIGSPWNNGDSCPGNMGGHGPSVYGLFVTPLNRCNAAGAQARIQRVADYIEVLDVDILNLVEVEGCGVLDQLVDSANTSYSTFLGIANDTVTFKNLGLLSKLDATSAPSRIMGTKSYPLPGSSCGFNGSGSTDVTANVLTTFQVSNFSTGATSNASVEAASDLSPNRTSALSIAFIGLELPGFPLDPESCAIREAQAAIIEEEIQRQVQAGQEVIVAGNFDDWSPDDATATGQTPISQVLQMLQKPSSPNATPLYSVSSWLSDPDSYTSEGPAVAGGSPTLQAVDFMLITPGLASLNVTAQIVRNNATLNTLSSHWPIVVTFSTAIGNVNANLSKIAPVPAYPNSSTTLSSSVLAASVVTSASATTSRDSKSGSLVLPIVLGVLGTLAFVAVVALLGLLVFCRKRRGVHSHKRLQRGAQVENVEQALQSLEEPQPSHIESLHVTKEDEKPSEEEFRPINRAMPTIKSGEILEVELYVKSLFDND